MHEGKNSECQNLLMRIAKQNRCSMSQQGGHTAESRCGSADIVIAHESVSSFGGIAPLCIACRAICEAGTNTRINHTLKNVCVPSGGGWFATGERSFVTMPSPESTTMKYFPADGGGQWDARGTKKGIGWRELVVLRRVGLGWLMFEVAGFHVGKACNLRTRNAFSRPRMLEAVNCGIRAFLNSEERGKICRCKKLRFAAER
jgi:hypothetical protein